VALEVGDSDCIQARGEAFLKYFRSHPRWRQQSKAGHSNA
jgi:hypothetical protein